MTPEAKKAVTDTTPLVGHLRHQPRGFPRNSWRLDNVLHPSQWNREHWSYDKSQRPRKARKEQKPKLSPVELAMKQLAKLIGGK